MPTSYKQRLLNAYQALQGRDAGAPASRPVPAITPEESREARLFFRCPSSSFTARRSGTTMLVRIVRVHPQVHCDYQAHFFTRQPLLESLVASPQAGEWLAAQQPLERGRDCPRYCCAPPRFHPGARRPPQGKTIVGDKSPNSCWTGRPFSCSTKSIPTLSWCISPRRARRRLSHRFQPSLNSRSASARPTCRYASPSPPIHSLSSTGSARYSPPGLAARRRGLGAQRHRNHRDWQELFNERFFSCATKTCCRSWDELTRLWRFWRCRGRPRSAAGAAGRAEAQPDADCSAKKPARSGRLLKGSAAPGARCSPRATNRPFSASLARPCKPGIFCSAENAAANENPHSRLCSIGRRHFRNLLALGERDILFYRTGRGSLGAAPDTADEILDFPVETDLQTALAHRPEAVIIANPTALHLQVAVPAAQAAAACF